MAGGFDDAGSGGVAGGIGDGNVDAEAAGGEQEGMSDVIAVAYVGEFEACPAAEAFLDGLDVSKDLARMVDIAEGVDDGDRGVGGKGLSKKS